MSAFRILRPEAGQAANGPLSAAATALATAACGALGTFIRREGPCPRGTITLLNPTSGLFRESEEA